MRPEPSSWRHPLAATLLLLSPFDLLASLGMDMYLPAVPSMAGALATGPGTIQLTLTVYLVLVGAGQLLFGPLSDRLGRRPVLLGGAAAYALASFGLAAASTPGSFLALRVLQAAGASACLVATFATVRDVYSGRPEASVVYGLLGSMLALVPAAGPLLGALVSAWLGWRGIFAVLGLGMLAAMAAAWRRWPETRRLPAAGLQWRRLLRPLRSRHFRLHTLGYSAAMGSFFVFFSTAPWVLMERHGLSQIAFSALFGTVALAMMLAARSAGRIIPRLGPLATLRVAMACMLAGASLLAVCWGLRPGALAGYVVPMWLVGAGIALAVSAAPNGALEGFDDMAGTATAVYFCLGGLLLGVLGTAAASLLPRDTAWPVVAYAVALPLAVLALSALREGEASATDRDVADRDVADRDGADRIDSAAE